MARFVVIDGPNRGAVISVTDGVNVIGRDQSLQIALPDQSISRRHAKLVLEQGGWRLIDLNSTNCTYVNGVQLTGAMTIANRDEVRLGNTTVLFLTERPAEADGEPPSSRSPLMDDTSKLEGSADARGPRPARSRGAGHGAAAVNDLSGARPRYMVGESPALRQISEQIARCAPLDATVLVMGESGTGKELVAEALHRLGPRRGSPFIVINCATLEPALLESELFGHERGAFTGAVARKVGKLELARDGTLFLDEIGELPLAAQAKLLRAIDRREFTRLGGHEVLSTNARFVCATHRDLATRVRLGDFREDLLFRLRVVEIRIPPLRERTEDIPPLVQHFIAELREKIPARARAVTRHALELLVRYQFPGNARELRNLIERCLIFCEHEAIEAGDLPPEVRAVERASESRGDLRPPAPTPGTPGTPGTPPSAPREPEDDGQISTLEEMERSQISRALRAAGGNKSKAAKMLDIDRNTLHAKLKRYGLGADDAPGAAAALQPPEEGEAGTITSVTRRIIPG